MSTEGRASLDDILAPEYLDLSPQRLEQVLEGTLGEVSPEDLEDFWGSLKNVGGAVSKALPGIASGAITGATTGAALGPWGALGGAVLGGTLGGVQSYSQPSQRAPSAPQSPPGPPPATWQPQAPPMTPPPAPPSMAQPTAQPMVGGSPAAAQLLQAVFDPHTLQALMALLVGPAGRQNIPVGNTPVPAGAFPNMLSVLANRAAAEHDAFSSRSGTPHYLYDYAGEAIVDPAVAEDRAGRLVELLHEAGVGHQRTQAVASRQLAHHEMELESNDELYDDYDAMELIDLEEYVW